MVQQRSTSLPSSSTEYEKDRPSAATWFDPAGLILARGRRLIATVLGVDGKAVIVETGANDTLDIGWVPALTLNAALALLLVAIAANASRDGVDWAVGLFYLAIALAFFPIAVRMSNPDVSRAERVRLVALATMALFAARAIRAPIAFIDHDEFLHWLTAIDIMERGRLFTPNALLPVSPSYPGLELITTAIAHLTGLSIFGCAMLLLAACRFVFMMSLFIVFERITASSRVAGVACLLYMGSSTFFIFDAHFAYESLAVAFLVTAICADALSEDVLSGAARKANPWWITLGLTVPLIAALAVTHHMTAFFAAGLFVVLALLELVKTPASLFRAKSITVAAFAIAAPVIWSSMMGNPTEAYLGPVIQDGLREVTQIFSSAQSRKLFVSDDGSIAPVWQRIVAIGSVALICAGLATGFLRSLSYAGLLMQWHTVCSFRSARSWNNSRLVLLTAITLAYPASILFRLTRSGWEIGNRIGPFSFLGVSLIVAIGIVSFWIGNSKSAAHRAIVASALTVILIGGIISAEGPRILVPSHFHVSADAASVETMGVETAQWSRAWLGPGNHFASDRINRLLLATYGRQEVASTLQDPRDVSLAIQSQKLGAAEIALLRQLQIDYVLTDLRLTTALPVVGVYFDGGAADRGHTTPLATKALLKFNFDSSVSRPFDNGYQIIFDVRKLDVQH